MNKDSTEKNKPRIKSSRNNSEPDKSKKEIIETSYDEKRARNVMVIGSGTQENPVQAELSKINQYNTTVSSISGLKPSKEPQNRQQIVEQIPLRKAELNTQIQTQNQYQHNPIILMPNARPLNENIEEQGEAVHRVKFTTRKYQKIDMGRTAGSPFKMQMQKTGIRNYVLEAGSKNQQKQLSSMIIVGSLDNKSQNENVNKRAEALRITPMTPVDVGDSGSGPLLGKKMASSAQNNGANNVSTSTTIIKPLESKRANWSLSEEEKSLYGDRCPEGYEKLELLGRGGFAIVWLAKNKATGEKVALKQILQKNAKDCMQKEVHFGQVLFAEGGVPRKEFKNYPGIENIVRFIDYKQTRLDTWLVFELGGSTLSKMLFEIKGEFNKGERIYNVKHLDICKSLRENYQCLKLYIRQMAETLHLLSDLNIIHCDLKPDNVLLTKSSELDHEKLQIKLIDFGSAFSPSDPGSFGMATPEYMPPEVLTYLSGNLGSRGTIDSFLKQGKSWSIDVWSLGAIILEIITGIPLWLSLKCKTSIKNKRGLQIGLFAVKGRDYEKIKLRQKSVLENLESTIGEYIYEWENSNELFNLLQGMLQWDPKLRISPADILNHSYLNL